MSGCGLRATGCSPTFLFGAYGLCNRPLSGFCRASSSTPMRMSKATSSPLVNAAVILSLLARACATPTLSSISPANAAQTRGVSVTISGLNFASTDPTPSASLELSVECSSTSWSSATAVACAPASYRGGPRRTAVTVGKQAGTLTGQFSYDSAQKSRLRYACEAYSFLRGTMRYLRLQRPWSLMRDCRPTAPT